MKNWRIHFKCIKTKKIKFMEKNIKTYLKNFPCPPLTLQSKISINKTNK